MPGPRTWWLGAMMACGAQTGDADGAAAADDSGTPPATDDTGAAPPPDTPFEISADAFGCITEMTPVRGFYVSNLLGDAAASVAAAEQEQDVVYPVGTLIQLVPTEAMVKRQAGFSPEAGDWEFFFLAVNDAGTTIEDRGTTDVVNAFGLNCLDCHAKAEPGFDFVCEDDHGCDPLPLTPELIEQVQDNDPRCR